MATTAVMIQQANTDSGCFDSNGESDNDSDRENDSDSDGERDNDSDSENYSDSLIGQNIKLWGFC